MNALSRLKTALKRIGKTILERARLKAALKRIGKTIFERARLKTALQRIGKIKLATFNAIYNCIRNKQQRTTTLVNHLVLFHVCAFHKHFHLIQIRNEKHCLAY